LREVDKTVEQAEQHQQIEIAFSGDCADPCMKVGNGKSEGELS